MSVSFPSVPTVCVEIDPLMKARLQRLAKGYLALYRKRNDDVVILSLRHQLE